MLDLMIEDRRLEHLQLDRLVETLAGFYRVGDAGISFACDPSCRLDAKSRLQQTRFARPAISNSRRPGAASIDQAQRRFLQQRGHLITARLRHRRIVDGHGDLRPEHIWLDDKVRIIDCLEFNSRLRIVDPFDEIAFLSLECERLGASWAGGYIQRRMKHLLRDGPADELFTFYRCHRATLTRSTRHRASSGRSSAHAGKVAAALCHLSRIWPLESARKLEAYLRTP